MEADKKSWLVANISPVLALTAVVLVISLFFMVILIDVPQGVNEVMLIIIGYLGGILSQVYSYHFGSSEGSKEKNKLLNGGK